MINLNNPIPQAWTDYVTQVALGLEVIPAFLWSVKLYPTAGINKLTFFDTTAGSRPDLTNMKTAGALPNPESFLIKNIRIFTWGKVQSDNSGTGNLAVIPSQFNDVVALTKSGLLNLKISNKDYGPIPLWTLPAHNFVKGAFASGSDLLADYGQLDGMLYELDPYLMLSPIQPFTVSLDWPGASTDTPIPGGGPAISGDTAIEVIFDGSLARAIN